MKTFVRIITIIVLKTVIRLFMIALFIVAIVPTHEITFSCGRYDMPVFVDGMQYVTDIEKTITVSWKIVSSESKHFSIEQYYAGDINSSFVISHNRHSYVSDTYNETWYTLNIECYKDVDSAWLNIEIKL